MTYQKGQIIGGYTVLFYIGEQTGGELYRVRSSQGRLCFLKLFTPASFPSAERMSDEHPALLGRGQAVVEPSEVTLRRNILHPNVCQFIDSGIAEDNRHYMVTQFVSSETLADRLRRLSVMTVEDACQLTAALLRLLNDLHRQGIAHRAIGQQSILLDLTGTLDDFRLTDFAQAADAEGVSVADDLYAAGRLLFRMVFGMEAEQPLRIPNLQLPSNGGKQWGGVDRLTRVLSKALADDASCRFSSANDFLLALTGRADHLLSSLNPSPSDHAKGFAKVQGGGFADVAGMKELKKLLSEEVLYVLRDRERALRYCLNIPNGMLLYGPPGCGKTFIAERFAEEAGYNFRFVKSSDLASIYIHGTQEKIALLFDEARAAAPCVLCFDEFEALVPQRTQTQNAGQSAEVNEFLTQLNNCGEDQVFVIATTNQPLLIDTAVLRRGRIDHLIYVPMPDEEARQQLFDIHLKNRPKAADIDCQRLARLTEGYIASEVAYVAHQAALRASRTDALITQQLMEQVVSETKPRTPADTAKRYEAMRLQLEQRREQRPKIGF
jgi:transitional endoplasmic reticulum ATPase